MTVLRDWMCLNPDCEADFESDKASPHCPQCRCAKVRWRPSGAHMAKVSPHADRTLRSVAQSFGLTDLRSARAGEAAHPGVRQPKPADERLYFGIPWSTRPTAGFAKDQPTMKIGTPVNGPKFKAPKSGRGIPTKIVATDPRKVTL